MRAWELKSGINIYLSDEEADLVERILNNNEGSNLNERDKVIANRLVSKGVLRRIEYKNHDEYKVIKRQDFWRD